MPQFYDKIDDNLASWAVQQPLFFTATAPSNGVHINVSPKGHSSASFSIISPNQVAYIDSTGSGAETISHIYENGRVTIMFISFATSPRILRFFCRGSVIERDDPGFEPFVLGKMKKDVTALKAARAAIVLNVFKVQTSCGYGVPILKDGVFHDRPTMMEWGTKKIAVENALEEYQVKWNTASLDGCCGLKLARRNAGEKLLFIGSTKAWIVRIIRNWDSVFVGVLLGLLIAYCFMTFGNGSPNLSRIPFVGDW